LEEIYLLEKKEEEFGGNISIRKKKEEEFGGNISFREGGGGVWR